MAKSEATTTYWRLRLDGRLHGLFRRVTGGSQGLALAHLGESAWIDDPELLRWWLDPGDRDLVEVSREVAQAVVREVDIDAPAEPAAKPFRELSTLIRRSFDLYITQAQELNPGAILRRVDEPRPEGDAVVIPFEDAASGSRYEVLAWPDGAVNGLRQVF